MRHFSASLQCVTSVRHFSVSLQCITSVHHQVFVVAFLGSGDQSIRGPLTKLFGFGLSIMEKMAVVKIVTKDERKTEEEDGKLFSKILMLQWKQCLHCHSLRSRRAEYGTHPPYIHGTRRAYTPYGTHPAYIHSTRRPCTPYGTHTDIALAQPIYPRHSPSLYREWHFQVVF